MADVYTRTGRVDQNARQAPQPVPAQAAAAEDPNRKIEVNGFKQIVDMLNVADPQFRESLLARIQRQDPGLAANLRKAIVIK